MFRQHRAWAGLALQHVMSGPMPFTFTQHRSSLTATSPELASLSNRDRVPLFKFTVRNPSDPAKDWTCIMSPSLLRTAAASPQANAAHVIFHNIFASQTKAGDFLVALVMSAA
ncbi:hypothetical protein J1614_006750 [Plenodomus biglobosus]|nr:hypothetical protein J1614_006750 [Plenodomus biglobosus]